LQGAPAGRRAADQGAGVRRAQALGGRL